MSHRHRGSGTVCKTGDGNARSGSCVISGMPDGRRCTEGVRFSHSSHYVSHNFFSSPLFTLDIDLQLVFLPTCRDGKRGSATSAQFCLCCSLRTNHEQVFEPPGTHLPHLETGHNEPSPSEVLRIHVNIRTS